MFIYTRRVVHYVKAWKLLVGFCVPAATTVEWSEAMNFDSRVKRLRIRIPAGTSLGVTKVVSYVKWLMNTNLSLFKTNLYSFKQYFSKKKV